MPPTGAQLSACAAAALRAAAPGACLELRPVPLALLAWRRTLHCSGAREAGAPGPEERGGAPPTGARGKPHAQQRGGPEGQWDEVHAEEPNESAPAATPAADHEAQSAPPREQQLQEGGHPADPYVQAGEAPPRPDDMHDDDDMRPPSSSFPA